MFAIILMNGYHNIQKMANFTKLKTYFCPNLSRVGKFLPTVGKNRVNHGKNHHGKNTFCWQKYFFAT
jgi:hypothetical protein